ncbi:5-nucleotidase SurE [Enhygromyxa salina]|uniref:5'-nucleotidase SurE n=1 Tax=Enhygromyxa salina TaxID=215803 RepID=A0A0C2CWQ1_9BACT|nr:5'/3'-nucleotidase SurE [Enhygromyxa salina]KIG12282.1 5-nucleotidase SurE [Enhygromyxa salina]
MSRPLILVSNDDGIRAPGLRVLAEVAAEFGEVLVCAPNEERSGFSHAISLRASLRSERAPEFGERWFAVSGTPVDCVYLACLHLCERLPDLVLSGINPGYNLGADVFYSGTVGAAREGLLRGCSSLAVSVQADANPEVALPFVRTLVPRLLAEAQAGTRHLLNLNVPREGGTKGLRAARLGHRRYRDQVAEREDLAGRSYFWIGGPPAPLSGGDDDDASDTGLVGQGYAALTPLEIDITAPDLGDWVEWISASSGRSTGQD